MCVSGQVSGLVSAAEGDIPGSRGCGRGTERVEDTPGTGERNLCKKRIKPSSKNIQFLIGFMISVGSNSNTGPATLLAAGRPQGPDDRTAQTQAADG